MITGISSVNLRFDHDLVAARRRARSIAAILGFDAQEQTRIATVASEIARNALRYAEGGRFEFGVESDPKSDALVMTVTDRGKGIANLDDILNGLYHSDTGMGLGILGARRLMDEFEIRTAPGLGTVVVMKKLLPPGAERVNPARASAIAEQLTQQKPEDPIEEMQRQNADLLMALSQLNERQDELERLNRELEDTNRGVLALYAELDEKAESLRRADQLKSHFLSDMSHEFRTPVNAILALTRMLDEAEISGEGPRQVSLIRRAAEDLESLVSDLLDIAKIESGKVDVRVARFEVETLFSALRGMLRPLLLNRSLSLVFDDVSDLPPMDSDEGKISQILRNFISNAIKFTEAGEVRVSASLDRSGEAIVFAVADTGIGIASEDQERIFEEFVQIDGPYQRKQKGTGLGLPLTRKLAALLGGSVAVRSQPGVGSTFITTLPLRVGAAQGSRADTITAMEAGGKTATQSPQTRLLIIDDDETARYTLATFGSRPGLEFIQAENGLRGIEMAQVEKPALIFLDMVMPGIGGHEVLQRLKQDPATADIPVIIVTSRFVNEDERDQILSRAVSVVYKGDLSREVVKNAIDGALAEK